MRILADENIPLASVRARLTAGHEVPCARDLLPGGSDLRLLHAAATLDALLLTFDRDFGALAFEQRESAPAGVLLLRVELRSPTEPAEILLALLGDENLILRGRFTVVESERIRQRPLPTTESP
jgi:predicted nuclease of predicted toxin-antitoxin system